MELKKYFTQINILRFTTLCLLCIFAYIAGLAYLPRQAFYNLTDPIPIVNTAPLKVGEAVIAKQSFCKREGVNAPSIVKVYLERETPKYSVQVNAVEAEVEAGCHEYEGATISIPDGIAPGRYRIRYESSTYINRFNTQEFTTHTEYFNVTDRSVE